MRLLVFLGFSFLVVCAFADRRDYSDHHTFHHNDHSDYGSHYVYYDDHEAIEYINHEPYWAAHDERQQWNEVIVGDKISLTPRSSDLDRLGDFDIKDGVIDADLQAGIRPDRYTSLKEPVYDRRAMKKMDKLPINVKTDLSATDQIQSNINRNLNAQNIMALSSAQCLSILTKNKVSYRIMKHYSKVKTPIRVFSRLGGVQFRQLNNNANYSVMDCRLVVSLLVWSKVLRHHGIVEVHYMRSYTRAAKVASSDRPSGHSWGLAIDAAKFKSKRYGLLDVKTDWLDKRKGISPCGLIQNRYSDERKVLRALVCETVRQNIFAVILTPHYNKVHHDHLHIGLRKNQYRMVLK